MYSIHRTGLAAGFLLAAALNFTRPALAEVTLPHVFGSHMVLQQQKPAQIWGWAKPGEAVTVQLGTAKQQTLFAVNHWIAGVHADLGIGSRPAGSGSHPDWTFAGNADTYQSKRLRILVHVKE